MTSWSDRLNVCIRDGNMTVADLARWFGRPHPTVRQWVHRGFEPRRGGPHDAAWFEAMLTALERLIKRRYQFPLSRHLSPRARADLIRQLSDATNNRLLEKDTA